MTTTQFVPDGTGYLVEIGERDRANACRYFQIGDGKVARCRENVARFVVDIWEHNTAIAEQNERRTQLRENRDRLQRRRDALEERIEAAGRKHWTTKHRGWTLWIESDLKSEDQALNAEAAELDEYAAELDAISARLTDRGAELKQRHDRLHNPPRPEVYPAWASAMLPPTQPVYDYPVQPDEYAAPPVPNYAAYMNQSQNQTPLPQQHAAPQRSGGGHGDAFEDLL